MPPPRTNQVARPALIAQLNRGLTQGHSLTLVSAPAGFGKTTLVTQWLAQLDQTVRPLCWVSLDQEDDDPQQFFRYLTTAVSTLPANPNSVADLLNSPQPPPAKLLMSTFLNDVTAVSTPFILVLDDLHDIESTEIEQAMTLLVEHMPSNMHLVLISRTDPALPLSRLRARGQLTEIRIFDLRFTENETTSFLHNVMQLNISPESITALEARTEGWVAGLQLAAVSMQASSDIPGFIDTFTGSHRYIMDYLTDEVLQRQPASIQQFLLQTAVLNRFRPSLCAALIEQPINTVEKALNQLEAENLFLIPLDDERQWYRYHHLFADLLRRRLHQADLNLMQQMHLRASRWFAEHNYQEEAIDHAIKGEGFETAVTHLDQIADQYWERGQLNKLRRWIEQIPAPSRQSTPNITTLYAWILCANGEFQQATAELDTAANAIAPTDAQMQGRIAVTQAMVATFTGQVTQTIQHAKDALQKLPDSDSIWRGNAANALGDAYGILGQVRKAELAYREASTISLAQKHAYLSLIVGFKLAGTLRQQLQLHQAFDICQHHLQLAADAGMADSALAGVLHAVSGEILCEWNQLDEAVKRVEKGVTLTRQGDHIGLFGWSILFKSRVLLAKKDADGVLALANEMQQLATKSGVPPWIKSPVEAISLYGWLLQGDMARVQAWMQSRQFKHDAADMARREPEYAAALRVMLLQQPEETHPILDQLIAIAERSGKADDLMGYYLIKAMAYHQQRQMKQAMQALEKSLLMAQPAKLIRSFVDGGAIVEKLLQQAIKERIVPNYTRQLLQAFENENGRSPNALQEPLSEREIEVLTHIANGLKNKEIAEQLSVSLNTVLFHTKNIYGKLNVNKRIQAVSKAKALGLL